MACGGPSRVNTACKPQSRRPHHEAVPLPSTAANRRPPPRDQQLPQYCSWEFLLRNELARDEGRRMYYIDETGETVPASDDEDDRVGAAIWRGAI